MSGAAVVLECVGGPKDGDVMALPPDSCQELVLPTLQGLNLVGVVEESEPMSIIRYHRYRRATFVWWGRRHDGQLDITVNHDLLRYEP